MKIDCGITENYLKEFSRMCEWDTQNGCMDCCFYGYNNGTELSCFEFRLKKPMEAIDLIQKWSDKHSQKTILEDLLEKYPDYQLDAYDLPKYICPDNLGFSKIDSCKTEGNCTDCWNRPIK